MTGFNQRVRDEYIERQQYTPNKTDEQFAKYVLNMTMYELHRMNDDESCDFSLDDITIDTLPETLDPPYTYGFDNGQ